MITLINATNRPENLTGKVVRLYEDLLCSQDLDYQVFELAELQDDFIFKASFGQESKHMEQIVSTKIIPADKLIFFIPEYNGSYPGILKAFIDSVHPKFFRGKRAALVGVATGRAGNLRGMDHLTDVLHHLQIEVLSMKVPISKLDTILDDDGVLRDIETKQVLLKQLEKLKVF